ncbi:glycerol-3-phosphate 1-O-acyltransferase PlsY [Kordiimonas pumila]|uniref:Glycerol-3-phosphate acyltransferase n=1 Tax=Kordiimonas pumila TaxID=2161677 RepID=A0ABV7D0P4_9PROT|nr:glycerol-3-phosphate 1-O-acyltransferase PlsY [Kordiimonas pumila]
MISTDLIIAIIGGYLLGSIPFGLVLTRLAGLGDIRTVGSGNIGATNVLRTGRKDLAALTLLLDAGKGAIAALIALALWGENAALMAGTAAFIGHCFPVYLKFHGGKGVATFFGTIFAINPDVGFASAVAWLAIALMFRMSSFAALVAALIAPAISYICYGGSDWIAISLMVIVIFIRHKDNIGRIIRGEESKIGQKKKI